MTLRLIQTETGDGETLSEEDATLLRLALSARMTKFLARAREVERVGEYYGEDKTAQAAQNRALADKYQDLLNRVQRLDKSQ